MSLTYSRHHVRGRRVICYALASGEHSDQCVHCIFEREEDAKAYLTAQGYVLDATLPYYSDPWRKPDQRWDAMRIEEYQYWPAGEVPHADAA